ncbi:MAG TPA: hypothetical protein VI300_01590 [Solirubrobacter sp.]
MSAVTFDAPAPVARVRLRWGQAIGAVLWAWLFAWALSLLWVLPLAMLRVMPLSAPDGVAGHGWPWRIDGPWSLAADVGPLLLAGLSVAFGIELFTRKWTGVSPRRLPFVVVAATLGWLPLGGVLGVGGAVAFFAMVWLTRNHSSRAGTPLRWTRARALAAIAGVLALAATSFSFGLTHPLESPYAGHASYAHGATTFHLELENIGLADARVLGIDVPGHRVTRARTENEAVREARTSDQLYKPLVGSTVAAGKGRTAYVSVASTACVIGSLDRVGVRLRVAGQTVRQVVHLPRPAGLICD